MPYVWLVLALPFVALVGGKGAVWWEKRHPSSFTRQPECTGGLPVPLEEEWDRMSACEQAAYDEEVLRRSAYAEDAGRRAAEALLRRNTLYRP